MEDRDKVEGPSEAELDKIAPSEAEREASEEDDYSETALYNSYGYAIFDLFEDPNIRALLKDGDKMHSILERKLQRDEAQAKLETIKLQNAQFRDDMDQRRTYAKKVMRGTVVWLFCVLAVLILSSLRPEHPWKLTISENVLIALLTTTTINVIGLAVLVVSYLFFRPKPQ